MENILQSESIFNSNSRVESCNMETKYSGSTFADYDPAQHSVTDENHSRIASDDEVSFDNRHGDSYDFVNGKEIAELHGMVDKDVTSWRSEDLVGKCFKSIVDAESFYRAYSMKIGFGIRRGNIEYDKKEGIIIMRRWVCSRQGTRADKHFQRDDRKRPPKSLTRCMCRAAFVVRYRQDDGTYRVTTFNPEHTHEVADSKHVHFFRSHRKITTGQAIEIQTMKGAGIRTCQIMDYMVTTSGGYENVGFTVKDLYNFTGSDHERTTKLNSDAESTIAYFTALVDNDPGLYVRYAVDERNKLCRIFWADSRSRLDYSNFGDVIVIDSTYKTNTFKLPLVEFVGVNNHQSSIVFGCALISEETIDAYTWAFRTFLHAMSGKHPISVLTDGDRAIQSAISTVMPQARHRLCSWHLMRNARVVSPDEDFLGDFKKCMLHRYSHQEFDKCWISFVKKHKLGKNDWIDEMYQRKERWAEAFFKGVFFAGMTTSQRCESMHSYMNRFLNTDLSLYKFVKQYYRAMNRIRQNELRHDFLNNQTKLVLQTHLKALERSASNHYTRSVFLKVRQEIEKESKYTPFCVKNEDGYKEVLIVKYGDEATGETNVKIRDSDQCLSCTCGKFESVWWPCRHMFCAMKAVNMTVIPEVMLQKRWAKDISLGITNNQSNMPMSITQLKDMRFGSLHAQIYQLCHLASDTEDLYRLAMSDIEATISRLVLKTNPKVESPACKRQRLTVNCPNIIRDPEIVRTKGAQTEGKASQGKKRRCRICKKSGHNKSSCTQLKEKVEGMTEEMKNPDEHVTIINEDDIFC